MEEAYGKLQDRYKALLKSYEKRSGDLNHSLALQKYNLNTTELTSWMGEKIVTASDENYREMTNLQSKIQKHSAFESELQANEVRVEAVIDEGRKLDSDCGKLKETWLKLLELTNLKKHRLNESYQAMLLNNNFEDFEKYLDDLEILLGSSDHGSSLEDVEILLKKVNLIEAEYASKQELLDQFKKTVNRLRQNGHYMIVELEEKLKQLIDRYGSLSEPLVIRKENLEQSHLLYKFYGDYNEELDWIKDKTRELNLEGLDLVSIQNLMKKRDLLDVEITLHGNNLSVINSRGQAMVKSGHFAKDEINGKLETINDKFEKLKDNNVLNKLRLQDALESVMFLNEANECMIWMGEKNAVLVDTDIIPLKKLDKLRGDLTTFESNLNKTVTAGDSLVNRNHFDKDNIEKKINHVKETYSDLQKILDKKKQRSNDALKFSMFVKEAEELTDWILDQMHVAGSEDYGRDVEHVEILIQKFEAFLSSVLSSGELRVQQLEDKLEALIVMHPEKDKLVEKFANVRSTWEEFKELASARQDALEGAKQVHMYDRTADETIQWILEKDASLSEEIESLQIALRKQELFENDLAAVKEQVDTIKSEAGRLSGLFPDAKEHIHVKLDEAESSWSALLAKSKERMERLKQTEKLQGVFKAYNEYVSYLNELLAKIVSVVTLGRNVETAETQLNKVCEYEVELNSKLFKFETVGSGKEDAEVKRKERELAEKVVYVRSVLEKRKMVYVQNLDLQRLFRDFDEFEKWLKKRQEELRKDEIESKNLSQVEELLVRHSDFEKEVEAKGAELVVLIRRRTLVEDRFDAMKREEEEELRAQLQKRKNSLQKREPSASSGNLVMSTAPSSEDFPVHHQQNSGMASLSPQKPPVPQTKPKRTPSFTTRRRTQSFRRTDVGVTISGVLERKHELQAGGKRAAIRSWKTFHVVLTQNILNFYKDETDGHAAQPPINLSQATVGMANDYVKRKDVFRLMLNDGSEYLFATTGGDENSVEKWVDALSKVATGAVSLFKIVFYFHIHSVFINTFFKPS